MLKPRRRIAPLLLACLLAPAAPGMAQDDAITMLENMPGMQLIAAVDAMHAGDLTKAEALFSLAIQQKKLAGEGLVHAYFNRGLVRQRLGKLREAVADFSRALNSDLLSLSGRVEALYNRGLAWRRLGELQKAMDDFSRAIELAPRFAPPYYSRALGLAANGDYLLALVDLDKALKYGFAQRHKVHYSKAMIHLARGEQALAERELRLALKAAPDFKPARLRLAALKGRAPVYRISGMGGPLPAENAAGRLHVRQAALEEPVEPRPEPAALASARKAAVARRQEKPPRPAKRMARLARKAPVPAARKPATKPSAHATRQASAARRQDERRTRRIAGTTLGDGGNTGMMVPGGFAAPSGAISALLTTASISRAAGQQKKAGVAVVKKNSERIDDSRQSQARHGAWAIQLASARRQADVARRWQKMRARVTRQVANPKVRIVPARVKGRGVYYRLRLEGFAEKGRAAAHCARLKRAGLSCLVVKVR